MIHIGTSGWQYRDWRSRVYPDDVPQKRWLEHYATMFPTVELNGSFYRLPTDAAFTAWRRRTPDGFVMAVKASRYLTHIRRLADPKEPLARLTSRARRLGPRLGPLLIQLPPTLGVDVERLRGLLEALPSDLRAAIEFRDRSWMHVSVFELLDRHGVALVLPDRPGARVPGIVTGGWSYLRFHQGQPNDARYTRAKLRRWADRIAGLPANDVFVYFNNDSGGAAVRDARILTELLAERGCDVARPAVATRPE